jgi:hypothetical protein
MADILGNFVRESAEEDEGRVDDLSVSELHLAGIRADAYRVAIQIQSVPRQGRMSRFSFALPEQPASVIEYGRTNG